MAVASIEPLEARWLLTANLVADFGGIYPTDAVVLRGRSYFAADDGVHGTELWRSDGTAEGTAILRDLTEGSAGSNIQHLTVANNRVFFTTQVTRDGFEHHTLWSSDGTRDGTVPVFDQSGPNGEPIAVYAALVFNDRFVFATSMPVDDGGSSTSSIWVSDGTPAGTQLVLDIATVATPENDYGDVSSAFYPGSDGLIFTTHLRFLWRTDGTTAGTLDITDELDRPYPELGYPGQTKPYNGYGHYWDGYEFVTLDGRVYFVDIMQNTFWQSDGTAAGTRLVKTLNESGGYTSVLVDGQIVIQGSGTENDTLWISDGTTDGTTAVFFAGKLGFGQPVGGKRGALVFSASQADSDRELWTSDGTAAGTKLLLDINPGPAWSSPADFVTIGGLTFFTADDGVHGREVWRTDGTLQGTFLLEDVVPGNTSSDVRLAEVDGRLVITSDKSETLVMDPSTMQTPVGPTTASMSISPDQVLRIFGTRGGDNICVYQMQDNPDRFVVRLNGVKRSFARQAVRKLIIFGYGGDDAIAFNERNGLITLRSMIWAGAGNDTVHGNSTRDTIWGETGDDLIVTGRSADLVDGGFGDDSIYGSTGDDTLGGSEGADSLIGGRDDDLLSGGDDEGEDHLDGGGGADVIFGRAVFEIFFNGKQSDEGDPLDEVLLS